MKQEKAAFAVLVALSISHLHNDTIQSLISAVDPILKESYALTFTQIGLITLAFQVTASLLQPLIGLYTGHRVLPFTLILPHVNLFGTTVLTIPIGLILASAFSAIMVYAQELMPSRVGMVAGLFFGFAIGMGGVGAVVLGWLADRASIVYIYELCAYLPLIGLLTAFLPNLRNHR